MEKDFLQLLKRDKDLRDSVKGVFELGPEPRLAAALPPHFSPCLLSALRETGFEELYSHQRLAFDLMQEGRNILVSTPTASGKSLIYQLGALDRFLKDRNARFLFLYPFKALAQDQLQKMNELTARLGFPEFRAEIYDGDTTAYRRKKIQQDPPPVLMTNPDMLHLSFLAYRENWRDWFDRLVMVAVDEAHIYRGVFGAHVHHLFWRLKRVAPAPMWIGTSATIGEGRRFFQKLISEEAVEVRDSGAPRPPRRLFVLHPKASPYTLACFLMEKLIENGKRTVTFTKARRITELVYNWLINRNQKYRKLVSSYRAGFLPSERRNIERRFFEGSLLGVVSTSAMEAGIDVGGLDACVLVGFPGSLVSLYQRMGRVGRGEAPADIFLITMPDALDQYYLTHQEELLTRKVEEPILDPGNERIAESHLLCAAKELPLTDADYPESHPLRKTIDSLDAKGRLVLDAAGDKWHTLARNPHREVNLRSLGESYQIVDENERTIGTIDGVRVWRECHQGAVYLHQGQSYEVLGISEKDAKVLVKAAFSDHYTEVRSEKETEILEVLGERELGACRLCLARVKVRERVTGYVKKKLFSNDTIAEYPLEAPPTIFETESVFLAIPARLCAALEQRKLHQMGSLHAVEHALIGVFPLLAMADRWDLGGISYLLYPEFGTPAIFLYDGYPGGIGISRKGFDGMEELLGKTLDLVSSCECEDGCPSCIQSPKCGNGNRPLDKEGAVHALRFLLQSGSPDVAAISSLTRPRAVSRQEPPARNLKRVVFDLETKKLAEEVGGWGNIGRMGLALACLWDIDNDSWHTFLEKDAKNLVEALLSAELVIGFNTKRFDYAVLQEYTRKDLSKIKSLDLLEVIYKRNRFRVSLDSLARANFGAKKSADGIQSVQWFREGRLDLIEEYCRKDVELTGRLYLKGLEEGHILMESKSAGLVRINVGRWVE